MNGSGKCNLNLRNLFTLLMNEPTHLKRIVGYGDDFEVSPGRFAKERIYISLMQSSNASRTEMHPSDMLLVFPTIKEQMSRLLDGWFSESERLRPIYTLFFGSMYFSTMYPRFHFLNLIQAIETFHRNMRKGSYTTKEKFKKISKRLKKAIPKRVLGEFRIGLESRIDFGNEYSLKTRIRLLSKELEAQTIQLITPDVDSFIIKIVATRNYFTHYTSSLKKKPLNGDDLHYANYKLRVLLIILLLKQVGLGKALIRDAICGNNELVYGLSEGQGVKDFLSKLKSNTAVIP